jgi:hypothetical protein
MNRHRKAPSLRYEAVSQEAATRQRDERNVGPKGQTGGLARVSGFKGSLETNLVTSFAPFIGQSPPEDSTDAPRRECHGTSYQAARLGTEVSGGSQIPET